MQWLFAAALGACMFPAAAQGWNWADDTQTRDPAYAPSKALCARLRDLQPPAHHYPSAAVAKTLDDCDSEALYYGIGRPADPVRARQCALLEADRQPDAGVGFTGLGMLMTIYANGVGAERDLQLATALACRVEGAPFELAGRIEHLQQLRANSAGDSDFGFCDDITSGRAMAICARHNARLEDDRRAQRLEQLGEYWNDEERAAFQSLLDAMHAFADASSSNEVDLSGSGRWAFVAQREQRLRDAFLAVLETLESYSLPSASAAEYQAADDRLNAVYRRVMAPQADPAAHAPAHAETDSLPNTTVTRSGIREAQRAWIAYRDAWLVFAQERYRRSGDSLGTWLTRQRADALAAFLPEPSPPRAPEPGAVDEAVAD